jgi:DNA-binding CsgD family transcriptional regulator
MALDNIATDLAVPARTDYRLSAHERELFVLMADGRTFEDAARALGISGHTAKNEASAVYARLGVSGLVEFYAVAGWLRVPR